MTSQLRSLAAAVESLPGEGFDAVHRASDGPVEVVPRPLYEAPLDARRQEEDPMTMRFGLQVGRFTWPGGPAETARRLAAIARAAEDVGFSSLSVMDHFVQIPQVGREWEDVLESTATLGYLAASTSTIRLGALVGGVTYRNVAHVAKIVATLDVLSEGRAFCGIGAAWFRREHELYGFGFPDLATRYELLEDALELLPLMWGKGTPRSPAVTSRFRRRRATRVRCRSACRSSSAARANDARCASSPATPTPATSSGTPPPSPPRSPCCDGTAPRSGGTPATSP